MNIKVKGYKFIVEARRWFDYKAGNTYHTVRITSFNKKAIINSDITYGYGDHYRQTALALMIEHKLIPKRYHILPHLYERENDYPICWNVSDVFRKRDLRF